MAGDVIDRRCGRDAFGADPAAYHAARPAYPVWVFDTLVARCGLAPGTSVFEVGPGTGTATRRLLDFGADPLVAVEPNARLAAYLRCTTPDHALTVQVEPFEDARLPESTFDLGVSATAFHWLDEDSALRKVARLLRPGGWWAMVWNVFGDDSRPDPFHDATKDLLAGPHSLAAGARGIPFGLDAEARIEALRRTHAFDAVEHRIERWPLHLDPDEVVALYATYSNVTIRPDRESVLAHLRRIARDAFGGWSRAT